MYTQPYAIPPSKCHFFNSLSLGDLTSPGPGTETLTETNFRTKNPTKRTAAPLGAADARFLAFVFVLLLFFIWHVRVTGVVGGHSIWVQVTEPIDNRRNETQTRCRSTGAAAWREGRWPIPWRSLAKAERQKEVEAGEASSAAVRRSASRSPPSLSQLATTGLGLHSHRASPGF